MESLALVLMRGRRSEPAGGGARAHDSPRAPPRQAVVFILNWDASLSPLNPRTQDLNDKNSPLIFTTLIRETLLLLLLLLFV